MQVSRSVKLTSADIVDLIASKFGVDPKDVTLYLASTEEYPSELKYSSHDQCYVCKNVHYEASIEYDRIPFYIKMLIPDDAVKGGNDKA